MYTQVDQQGMHTWQLESFNISCTEKSTNRDLSTK